MTRSTRCCWLLVMVLAAATRCGSAALADDDARDLKIWKALGTPTKIDFTQVPLQDAADYLSDLHDLPIYLDVEAFEKAGVVYKSVALTRQQTNVPLWRALQDTLKPAKLSFMIKRHTLTITTAEDAKEWQEKNFGTEE